MDLLYQRYASPFSFMSNMMRVGRFSEFVENIINTLNKETEEKAEEKSDQVLWELYLHRIFDKTYAEFKEMIKVEQDNKNMTASEIETTIISSKNILANFNPEERG